jgi:hypothetical protein
LIYGSILPCTKGPNKKKLLEHLYSIEKHVVRAFVLNRRSTVTMEIDLPNKTVFRRSALHDKEFFENFGAVVE